MTFAIDCIDDITAKVSAVQGLSDKTFSVYSEEDLLDKAKFIKLPAVGVMYEGLAANGGIHRVRDSWLTCELLWYFCSTVRAWVGQIVRTKLRGS